jgi:DNA-binding transcriptional ArsR family regulator
LFEAREVSDFTLPEATAKVAQALAHPVRLQILNLLRDEGAYVMHLTAVLDRPQANISQHLSVLREAGLVTDEREGMTVIYYVCGPRVFEVVDGLTALVEAQARAGAGELAAGWPELRRMRRRGARRCRCPHCRG